MTWTPTLAPADDDRPAFLRIADGVVADIRRGRLRPGDRLPGSRSLAERLGVHRNTVLAAVGELRAQGWVETRGGSGTYVAALPEAIDVRVGAAREPAYALEATEPVRYVARPPSDVLVFTAGRPDLRLLPVAELARAWRSAVRHTRGRLLDYGDPQGHPRLREALAGYLAAERGLAVGADELLVTRGSQMALYLVGQALIRPGDRVAVEALGYPPAWAALRGAGAELVPIEVDGDGMRVDQLEAALPLRAVYLTPHHQFPTMAVLPASRRLALLELARRHRIAVIEDDYDHEHHFVGRPVLPLASLDREGSVVYVGTLSKVLAPGLRVGYVAGPRPLVAELTRRRLAIDRQGDLVTEYALATLVEDGTLPRHLRRIRRVYRERQAHLVAALRRELGDRARFDVPPGGLALWVGADDVEAWARRAPAERVAFETGRHFTIDGAVVPYLRCGFASLDPTEIDEACRRLGRCA